MTVFHASNSPIRRARSLSPTFFFALIIFGAATTFAQQPDEVLKTETSLVQLNVGVVDRQGHAITSLSQNDFVIYEDGVKRPIQHFEPTEAPFSLVLLLDMSGSMRSRRTIASASFHSMAKACMN